MNSKPRSQTRGLGPALSRWSRAGAALLVLAASCQRTEEETTPNFADGGLLRVSAPLSRDLLMEFEGMFDLSAGKDLFGSDVAIRSSPGTVSILSGKDAGYAVLGAGCVGDGRLVLEGYWRYPRVTDGGLIRLFVGPQEAADKLCNGEHLPEGAPLTLDGFHGPRAELPAEPLTLTRAGALRPWRGKFFTTAHHGACELTDSCGVSPNTVETLRLAEQVGANAMEVDVRVTRDGHPILFHDPSLTGAGTKGTFCIGSVADLSLAELRANCQLVHGEKIPTLEEALFVMVHQTELEGAYLDLKVPEAMAASMDLALKYNEEARKVGRTFKALVAMPTDATVDAWKAAAATRPELPPCLVEANPQLMAEMGCYVWGPTWTAGPRVEDVEYARTKGGGVIYWTMNEESFIDEYLVQAKPNGFITARSALVFYRYQKIGTVPPPLGPVDSGEAE